MQATGQFQAAKVGSFERAIQQLFLPAPSELAHFLFPTIRVDLV